MAYQINKVDTATVISRQKNSGTVDQTNTSSIISTPYCVGTTNKVVFNTLTNKWSIL